MSSAYHMGVSETGLQTWRCMAFRPEGGIVRSLSESPLPLIAAVVLGQAVPAPAQLLNGSFENYGGSLANWTTFNNVIPNVVTATITPHSGTHVAKLFGGFNGDPNWSGLYQGLAAAPGQLWEATTYARHNSNDRLLGANHLVMKIEFYKVFGGSYGSSDFLGESALTILQSATPRDNWDLHVLQAVAPAQTVEARLAFVFLQFGYATGAALIDDVAFAPDWTPPPPPSGGWSPVWRDEFDGTSIDQTKWRVEDLHLIKNNELQYYAPDEVYLENGRLVLRSQERPYCGYDQNGDWGCYDYTSGLAETVDRFWQTFGRFEIRARLPFGQGIWPAHWTLPTSGAWPPEIDVMEMLGHEPTRVYMTHHWGSWPDVPSNGSSFAGPDFSQDFHTFAIEWFPDRIDWFIDGVMRFSSTTNIPQAPFYIILNTAVGGDWPGNPDGSTTFPQYHEIDYVRVYVATDPGDFDADGDVDLDDYAVFDDCVNGPGATPSPTPPTAAGDCLLAFDFDDDADTDLADFAVFQSAAGESGAP
jgi:beta-glucanase (GH16 family)